MALQDLGQSVLRGPITHSSHETKGSINPLFPSGSPGGRVPVQVGVRGEAPLREAENSVAFEAPVEEPNLIVTDSFLISRWYLGGG